MNPNVYRSSRPEVFCKKDVLRSFAKFTGKHLCQCLFFNKAAGCQSLFLIKLQAKACNFIKKETLTQVFSCEFCETSNTFFHRTPPVAASVFNRDIEINLDSVVVFANRN